MKRIGLLSDTHSYWDDRYLQYFEQCDEIWHAGDIGSMEVARRLAAFRMFRAVHGNIDSGDVRRQFPELLRWRCEDADILMKHIGGYPGRYDASIVRQIHERPPHLFISGHSHILKVQYDKLLGCLHINPGAAGMSGFHAARTIVRFTVDGCKFSDLEVVELAEKKR
ncbi:MAG: metallophosphoesterase family protein [Bacteroidaceae bacterium]|nr:metallophosphoesterase family protein [Bacteroidaceae bacterium]